MMAFKRNYRINQSISNTLITRGQKTRHGVTANYLYLLGTGVQANGQGEQRRKREMRGRNSGFYSAKSPHLHASHRMSSRPVRVVTTAGPSVSEGQSDLDECWLGSCWVRVTPTSRPAPTDIIHDVTPSGNPWRRPSWSGRGCRRCITYPFPVSP